MSSSAAKQLTPLSAALVSSVVEDVLDDGLVVRARPTAGPGGLLSARVALPGYCASQGDRVLLASDGEELFVVGVTHPRLLLVRYRDGAAEIAPARGDLRLAAPAGRVCIEAAMDVALRAERDVSLQGGRAVEATASPELDRERTSRLSLEAKRAVLSSPSLDVRARRTQVATADASVTARQIRTTAGRIATTVEELEVNAGRFVERAREAVQEIRGLLTSRAGRVRTLVRDGWLLRSRRTEMRSEEDTAIDGRRVLLG